MPPLSFEIVRSVGDRETMIGPRIDFDAVLAPGLVERPAELGLVLGGHEGIGLGAAEIIARPALPDRTVRAVGAAGDHMPAMEHRDRAYPLRMRRRGPHRHRSAHAITAAGDRPRRHFGARAKRRAPRLRS